MTAKKFENMKKEIKDNKYSFIVYVNGVATPVKSEDILINGKELSKIITENDEEITSLKSKIDNLNKRIDNIINYLKSEV